MNATSAFTTINPATEAVLAEYRYLSEGESEARLQVACSAQRIWAQKETRARAIQIRRLGEVALANAEALAALISAEMGKPVVQAEREVLKCAATCEYFSEQAEEIFAELPALSGGDTKKLPQFWKQAAVHLEPHGVLLGIMPWNFPLWQVIRFAVPAILGGNTVLVKHAPNVSGVAALLEKLFLEAGFAPGIYSDFRVPVERVPSIIMDRRIRGVSLTGSVQAGRAVATECGRALKKCVLELGGSDPFVVWKDAPLESTVKSAVQARLQNSGQSCIAAKRFLVHRDIFAEFREALIAGFAKVVIGDPLERATELGPIARRDLRDALKAQVGRIEPAHVLHTHAALPTTGFYYSPAVVAGVSPANPTCGEELFGPVALLFPVNDLAETICLANSTEYGLGASIWTQDPEIARAFIKGTYSGSVFVNAIVQSDPRLPFGGVKDSGFGRELGSIGSREFQNPKTVIWA